MSQLPTKEEILNWISENPTLTAKRDIAKAFGIKGAARIDLKRLLKELEAEGHLAKRSKTYRSPDKLPPVSVITITGTTDDGELLAAPMEWQGEAPAPVLMVLPSPGDPALAPGDRLLARVSEVQADDHQYQARLIRRIGHNPQKILGIFRKGHEGGRIVPIDKGNAKEWLVPPGAEAEARDGELVEAQQSGPRARMGLPRARIITRLGNPSAPKAVSLIAIHQHAIPDAFPDDVLAEADAQKPAGLAGRVDMRDMPLVTIDPWDARDHDDACYAHPDDDPANPGGHILWVAIADVAHYVRPGRPLDIEARKRGNSAYFPDRVVPMLPDRLSGDLCSLHEGVPRACIAVRMKIAADGTKLGHRFQRGLMRSAASLTYEEVQAAQDGQPNEKTAPLVAPVIAPLYAAYRALVAARERRQPLALDLPERKVVLTAEGQVQSVNFTERLDAHRLIEEFMVLANVAAAEELIKRKTPLLFRVHEEPSPEKLDALRETAGSAGFTLAKGQVLQTAHLNRLLAQAAGSDFNDLINLSTLRAMTQAYYSPTNFGHFGLALRAYAHFTSPIRRYADLVVHRALIASHGWGDDGLTAVDIERLEHTATHISDTERRAMLAERDTTDRYLAAFLSDRIGAEFTGKISGIAKFGVFVKLDETGADGIIPMRNLGREYFHFDADAGVLTGADSGLTIGLGQRVLVKLVEAAPVTGGLALELLELAGEAISHGPGGGGRGRGRGKPARRKQVQSVKKSAKIKAKIKRSRRS